MKAKLILETGEVFQGKAFGYISETVGELVFNTSMTGYQELLTDPSYYGQIVITTYPLIGNYGINLEDMQSKGIKVKGFVIKEEAKLPNNFRCELSIGAFLKQNKIMGIKGLDTRYLTKLIRDKGTMKAIITTKELTQKELKEKFDNFTNEEAVKNVTCKEKYRISGIGKKVGILDFGIKENIIESFKKRECDITVFPAYTKSEEILNSDIEAIFLSNGPGDPKDIPEIIENIKKLAGKKPIWGICLGHQLLSLALGGNTVKLKFGHRGGNHPVRDLEKNKIYITSQNHGYVVDKLPKGATLTHINLNDNSVEGMKIENLNIRSVQFHPEAAPGPEETAYIFDDFLKMLD
ncbi:carbamoyl-phosphate synthase small subunit [Hypnocyclicus thermotrophus]|uniref:Carbamoyl phosphate synthase small chain n=1 Tax=Hypnocyclicus thermotrophus TaxID=1627895 RepID=A0AA46DX16_9FUSO|nr:carbamoyl phosphate synthase small subunit [Hypnocyclicus thermotrophus]TDT67407.1 carbamoyl-phosphate synthase small subunit [Hypnocyclicus thermotrophus]